MAKSEKNYRVVKGTVGPWSEANKDVFTEAYFRELHPAPKDVDADKYSASLIARLVTLGVVKETTDDATHTRPGPHTTGNQGILDSIEASTQGTMNAKKVRSEIDKQDLEDAKAQ